MLHQRAGTGADPPGDVNFAAGCAVGSGVATVPFDDQFGTGIEPTGIRRGRTIDDDPGAFKAERADPLSGVFDGEFQRDALFGPERAADIVVTTGKNFKFGFPFVEPDIDLLQQLLGGNPLFIFIKSIDF